MEYTTRQTSDGIEAHLTGRLEFTDHDRLREIVALLDQPAGGRFVVDLSALEFIDSAGLGMLLILQDETEQRNLRFAVRNPGAEVKRSLDLARIGDIVTIED